MKQNNFSWYKLRNKLGIYKIINLIDSIKNIIRWFPIIWKDRDFDHSYIYYILKFKLNNQANFIEKIYKKSNRDVEILRLCVNLIDKLENDFYSTEYYDYHTTDIDFKEYELNIEITSERFDDYFDKYKAKYKKILLNPKLQEYKLEYSTSETNIKERMAMNIAIYNQNKAKQLLFRLMEENIDGWWE